MNQIDELIQKYKETLLNKVELGELPKDLLPPLSEFLPELYKANVKIDDIISSISQGKSNLREETGFITNTEKFIDLFLQSDYHSIDYEHVSAKVAITGQMLDKSLAYRIKKAGNKLISLEQEIETQSKKKNLETVVSIRKSIDKLRNTYNGLLQSYEIRELPEKQISQSKKLFSSYSSKMRESEKIWARIEDVIGDYRQLKVDKDFEKKLKKLSKESKKNKYPEGLLFIENLQNEVGKGTSWREKQVHSRNLIEKQTKNLEQIYDNFSRKKDFSFSELEEIKELNTDLSQKDATPFLIYGDSFNKLNEVSSKLNNLFENILKNNSKLIEAKQSENYWNNKFRISDSIKYKSMPETDDVVYKARNKKIWDVRDFIQSKNTILESVVKKNGLGEGTLDDIAYKCAMWVQEHIMYKSDPPRIEEWFFPTETLQTENGDCEDGTNLIVSLMRNAGVPAYRVKNACGSVPEGGHSWPIYLRETDEEWVSLDWSYKPNKKSIDKRKPAKEIPYYEDIWFAFNDEHSWSNDKIMANKSKFIKEKEEILKINVPENYVKKKKPIVFNEELDKLAVPSTDYTKIEDVVRFRVKSRGWVERMIVLDDTINELKMKKTTPSHYPMNLYKVMKEFYENGYLGFVAKQAEENNNKIKSSLNNLYQFASEVMPA